MKSVSISGSLRENVGKRDAKAQRAQGLVPCVIYGGKQQYQFVVEEKQFKNIIYTPEVKYAEIDLDGKHFNAILQETQFHPITDRLLHVDFLEVVENKPITIDIPVKITGTSPGVLRGGKMAKKVRKLKVRGLLENVPEYIELSIDGMEINDVIRVSNVNVPNITVVDNPSKVLVAILTSRNVDESATEAAE
ncbi:MAG: 50S ribosomal protein L25/general stress protein Ctc [Bacteroidales bacterium]|nr:50S ribosomal protein L25/general stress protein Ctc [Bacteroidales bacterium]